MDDKSEFTLRVAQKDGVTRQIGFTNLTELHVFMYGFKLGIEDAHKITSVEAIVSDLIKVESARTLYVADGNTRVFINYQDFGEGGLPQEEEGQ